MEYFKDGLNSDSKNLGYEDTVEVFKFEVGKKYALYSDWLWIIEVKEVFYSEGKRKIVFDMWSDGDEENREECTTTVQYNVKDYNGFLTIDEYPVGYGFVASDTLQKVLYFQMH